MKINQLLCAAGLLACTAPALALDLSVDSVSIEGGATINKDDTYMGRIGAQWDWDVKWLQTGNWFLGGYWDASVGLWHSTSGGNTIGDFGFTPVFRFQQAVNGSGIAPYVEAAVGAHLLTSQDISDRRQFSTNFQFGDHIGAGLRFGDNGMYDLSVRLQHLSNAGIDHPNPGINFGQLRFQYHF